MQVNSLKTLLVILFLGSIKPDKAVSQQPIYPKTGGHIGIIHPLITFNSEGSHTNFKDSYVVGIPIGINIWKTSKIGFSSEVVPFIKATANGSEVNNVLFHPGILVALGRGFTFAGRLAFETSGRYGITPVFNKVIKKTTSTAYFIAVPLPVRTGKKLPSSYGLGIQFGVAF